MKKKRVQKRRSKINRRIIGGKNEMAIVYTLILHRIIVIGEACKTTAE